jgi:hypothetical protein
MIDPETQARSIYDLMLSAVGDEALAATSAERKSRFAAQRETLGAALTILRESDAAVHLAFLRHSFEWLKSTGANHRLHLTLSEAAGIAVRGCAQPIPADVLLAVVTEYRQDFSLARYSFPLQPLLAHLTREQVSDELRTELRRIYLQFAPSPTGKLERGAEILRARIGELIYLEGDQALDSDRGPWSQIVFDEIKSKEPIARAGWEALLAHCQSLSQPKPSARWKKTAEELMSAVGKAEVTAALLRWVELGPTPGQPAEARSPIEDSPFQKGIVWCLALVHGPQAAVAIADFAIGCLRKVPMLGAVSQKVGLACVQALGAMGLRDALSQLTRLQARIKYSTAQKLIDKALRAAAEKMGVTVHELADFSVEGHDLDSAGMVRFEIGDAEAPIQLLDSGKVATIWRNADGKPARGIPASVKKAFPAEVRTIRDAAKEIEKTYRAQCVRLEASLVIAREMKLEHWRQHFLEHPLLGFIGRKLIWVFRQDGGSEQAAMWLNGKMCDASGELVEVGDFGKARLWHPLSTDAGETQRWRELVFKNKIHQPFRQAFREFYQVTEDERETRLYSNRFAGILMRQHQLASLCRERGWEYRLMGANFDGVNAPTKQLSDWKIHAEFLVDIPSDRKPSLRGSAVGEQSGSGINLFVGSDQVRFYRERREIAIDEVPALVYSEIMRDVDLFTSVCAVGDDETWSDQGDRGTGIILERSNVGELTAVVSLRIDLISRVLPLTPIADRCRRVKSWLEVRGHLGTYRVAVLGGMVARVSDNATRQLKIPQKVLNEVDLQLRDLPVDLDFRTEMVLRKAYVLADDWKITAPELMSQLMPE